MKVEEEGEQEDIEQKDGFFFAYRHQFSVSDTLYCICTALGRM